MTLFGNFCYHEVTIMDGEMEMNKSILLTVVVAIAFWVPSANAAVKKGQKAYLKTCKKCHGNGTKGAAMKTQAEWNKAFENDAALFRAWHKDDAKAMKFINSRKFEKYAPHLRDFLHEYGSDSGNIPSCG